MPRVIRLPSAKRLAVLAMVVATLVFPGAVAARQTRAGDISSTKLGHSLIRRASARFSARGYRAARLVA